MINSRGNEKAFSEDSSYYLLCSLENIDEDGNLESKADIFTKRTIRPERHCDPCGYAQRSTGGFHRRTWQVDIPFMAELLGTSG
ncbi:MAG: hypothetical protein ACLUEF_02425 [Faecalibacterium prausnitzii]